MNNDYYFYLTGPIRKKDILIESENAQIYIYLLFYVAYKQVKKVSHLKSVKGDAFLSNTYMYFK